MHVWVAGLSSVFEKERGLSREPEPSMASTELQRQLPLLTTSLKTWTVLDVVWHRDWKALVTGIQRLLLFFTALLLY